MLGIAEKNGHRITFWQFARYGALTTVVTVLLCVPYLGFPRAVAAFAQLQALLDRRLSATEKAPAREG